MIGFNALTMSIPFKQLFFLFRDLLDTDAQKRDSIKNHFTHTYVNRTNIVRYNLKIEKQKHSILTLREQQQ